MRRLADEDGVPVFQAAPAPRIALFLYACELVKLEQAPAARTACPPKELLVRLLAEARPGVQVNDHIAGSGHIVIRHAYAMGLEGIVSKRPYVSGPRVIGSSSNPAAPAIKHEAEEDWSRLWLHCRTRGHAPPITLRTALQRGPMMR